MTAYAIGYGVLALLIIFPEPLLLLDALFVRVVGNSIVKASEGTVDHDTAVRRIRRAEGLEPRESARIFAAIASVVVAVIGALAAVAGMMILLTLALAAAAAVMGIASDRTPMLRIGSAVAAALCFVTLV